MKRKDVAPFAGAWIEINRGSSKQQSNCVAPFAGAWIEITSAFSLKSIIDTSLPSRERGLKLSNPTLSELIQRSLPSRERGLKYLVQYHFQ